MPKAESGSRLVGWGGISVPGRELRSEELAAIAARVPLTRGLGRSYGDSSLPPRSVGLAASSLLADRILELDPERRYLHAEAGLSLADLVWLLLPRGLFPPVVPGTQFVTLGGMVAADVHGKNHHVDGTIGRHLTDLLLLTGSGRRVRCSRSEEPELFFATIGGMGLTGHILEVGLELAAAPVPWIYEEAKRLDDLESLLAALAESARDWPFTVGWIDCLAGGRRLGRGVLFRGRWATRDEAPARPPARRGGPLVPFRFPNWVLNDLTARAFNALYARAFPRRPRGRVVHPQKFFWPLDGIRHWNRIYGRRGFTQFQCVLPERERPGAAKRFLAAAAKRGGSSFLCVVKDCGAEGEGVLSFPRPGVSIALDLPLSEQVPRLVEELAEVVIGEGGRVYLAKDAFLRADQLVRMEPRLDRFRAARERWDPEGRIRSEQSIRLLGDPA